LKSRAQTGLAFARSLGIDVESLVLKDSETGKQSVLQLNETADRSANIEINLPKTHILYSNAENSNNDQHVSAPRLDAALENANIHEESQSTRHFDRLTESEKDDVFSIFLCVATLFLMCKMFSYSQFKKKGRYKGYLHVGDAWVRLKPLHEIHAELICCNL